MNTGDCELCQADGGLVLWRDARLRIVAVADQEVPAFLRVIWNGHVREMSDLAGHDAAHLLDVVLATERVLRAALQPDKINLASLGNVVPHLHWHVIPRFAGDAHFPQPVWGARQRDPDPAVVARQHAALPQLQAALAAALQGAG
jgi:diadenosine tetraphosphate (Ap4A) HIT family hydrolase